MIYLVPVLLHTALGARRESLRSVKRHGSATIRRAAGQQVALTFAISLQLRPASRMVLSLCSSSAVHGVLVRPFFLGVASTAGGIALGSPSIAPGVGIGAAIIVEDPAVGDGGRLRDVEEVCWGGC